MSAPTADAAAQALRPHTPIAGTLGLALGLAAVLAVILLAFSWPAVTSKAKDVPLAIAGPAEAVSAVEPQLADSGNVFELTAVDSRAAAVELIEQREAVGAIVLGAEPELLTASANGIINQVAAALQAPLQAALSGQAAAAAQAAGLAEVPEVTLTVTDVVPYASDDANGSRFASAAFPLLFGGMIGGIALSIAIVGSLRRVTGLLAYAAVGGIVLTAILQGWFGAVQGEFWLNAGAFALGIAAIAAPIIGVVALIGRAGIAVGPVVMMLFANPISGSALPAQFLPGVWGTVGQWFPPGASATLVRELSYFPDANMTFPWLALTGWTVGGIVLALIGHFRTATPTRTATGSVPVVPQGVTS